MKEMNKTYAIVEVIEGDQIQLVRDSSVCGLTVLERQSVL